MLELREWKLKYKSALDRWSDLTPRVAESLLVLQDHEWDRLKAVESLGIERSTLEAHLYKASRVLSAGLTPLTTPQLIIVVLLHSTT